MDLKLFLALLIVQIVAIVCGILFFFVGEKICMTKKCDDLASTIRDFIKDDIKPCKDFYSFSCGKMMEGDGKKTGLIDQENELIFNKIAELLEKLDEKSKPQAFYSAKVMYKQCKDRKESQSEVAKNMKAFIEDCGGFPASEGAKWDQNQDKFKLAEALKKLRENGLLTDAFFSMTFKRNPDNNLKTVMCITSPKPYVISRPAFLAACNDECQGALVTVYKKILQIVGVDQKEAGKEAKEMLYYDMKIASSTYNKPPLTPHDYTGRMMTLEKFTAKYDYFDWNYYFAFMQSKENGSIPKDTKVAVEDPEYLSELKEILQNMTNRQMANYIVWYNLLQFLYYPELPHTPTFCLDTFIAQTMPEMMTALTVRVRDDHSSTVNDILVKIGREVENEVKNAAWMDASTKSTALDKLKNLKLKIGYYELFLEDDLIDKYFNFSTSGASGKLNVGKDFYHSYRAAWMNKMQRETSCFSTGFDNKLCQFMFYGELNLISSKMFYEPMENELVVADAMLRAPLFYKFWPKYMYYSRFGFLLGHEYTHIFDSVGRYFNKDGDHKPWWGDETIIKFQERVKCFVEQLSEFKFFNGTERQPLPINMSLTEDMADVAGVTVAYNTYKKEKGIVPYLKLPKLDYNTDQLFFISLAQTFCDSYRTSEYPTAFWGVHLPNPVRVEEILQNSPEFSKAFSCEAGSEMNPPKRCSFW